MQKCFGLFLGIGFLFSCNSSSDQKSSVVDGTTRYEVYQPSEMAALMKVMHTYNEQLKSQILEDDITLNFPEIFENINTAEFTEGKGRTEAFDYYSGRFIEAQKAIFETDSLPAIERYNHAIDMCLSCHKTECTGPIPKIEKLLIK